MQVSRSRVHAPAKLSPPAVDAVVAGVAMAAVVLWIMLTPAFTDYESEAEPAIQAFIRGDFVDGLKLLPLYAGSVLAVTPFAALTRAFGGGDLAIYRAVAVPGAVLVGTLGVVAARWLREAGAERSRQLAVVLAFALSPCVALSWSFGHFEEPLVASLGLLGLVFAVRGEDRSALVAGVLLGLAAAGKLWAVVLLPVALVASPNRRATIRMALACAVTGAAVFAPYALVLSDHITTISGGTGHIFTKGNAWWFFGAHNPAYDPERLSVQMFTTANSPRLPPALLEAHARKLIVLVAGLLAAAWWYRVPRRVDLTLAQRLSAVLWLAAAVLWWRALLDPWFNSYYLTAAVMAALLADARAGRFPVMGLVAWAAIWLLNGPNRPDLGLDADQISALGLAWTIPFGLVLTRRALLEPRDLQHRATASDDGARDHEGAALGGQRP